MLGVNAGRKGQEGAVCVTLLTRRFTRRSSCDSIHLTSQKILAQSLKTVRNIFGTELLVVKVDRLHKFKE